MEMWFQSMYAMQKIPANLRFYLKESIIDNQGRLGKIQKFKRKKKNIAHSSTRF